MGDRNVMTNAGFTMHEILDPVAMWLAGVLTLLVCTIFCL